MPCYLAISNLIGENDTRLETRLRIPDITNTRVLEIDGRNGGLPGSVFISCGKTCVEVDRATLLVALSEEFHLTDPLEAALTGTDLQSA